MGRNGRTNETGVWLDRTAHKTDIGLLSFLLNFFVREKATIYDLGCGAGAYSKAFRAAGLDIECYDGSPHAEKMSDGLCSTRDLAYPVDLEPRDWVLSLEVGEHVPKDFEKVFIDNVTKLANKGMILSWAVPGQDGFGHYNCQPNDYIISEVQSRGFTHDADLQEQLRDNIRANKGFWYFENTLMAFRKIEE
jgi:hypothetical protein